RQQCADCQRRKPPLMQMDRQQDRHHPIHERPQGARGQQPLHVPRDPRRQWPPPFLTHQHDPAPPPVGQSPWNRRGATGQDGTMTLPPFLRDRRLFTMAAFGYFAGLPLPLSGFTLTQWLAEGGISLAAIGLTANIGLAYTLKFLWSPL